MQFNINVARLSESFFRIFIGKALDSAEQYMKARASEFGYSGQEGLDWSSGYDYMSSLSITKIRALRTVLLDGEGMQGESFIKRFPKIINNQKGYIESIVAEFNTNETGDIASIIAEKLTALVGNVQISESLMADAGYQLAQTLWASTSRLSSAFAKYGFNLGTYLAAHGLPSFGLKASGRWETLLIMFNKLGEPADLKKAIYAAYVTQPCQGNGTGEWDPTVDSPMTSIWDIYDTTRFDNIDLVSENDAKANVNGIFGTDVFPGFTPAKFVEAIANIASSSNPITQGISAAASALEFAASTEPQKVDQVKLQLANIVKGQLGNFKLALGGTNMDAAIKLLLATPK